MLVFPEFKTSQITAISSLCVACNGTSGAIAYLWRRQVHLKAAGLFTLASIPGAWLGSALTRVVDRQRFDLIFASLLFILGVSIIFKITRSKESRPESSAWQPSKSNYALGFFMSLAIGFLASFIGIGGGIVHVPLLAQFLLMPVHLAIGTSHAILALTAIITTIEHIIHHDIPWNYDFIPYLAVGTVIGAQIGAWLSKRVASKVILKLLSMAIISVSLRLFFLHFFAATR